MVGDPYEYARRYDSEGIDELLLLDAVASLYGRNGLFGFVERATESIFLPVTLGGGIKSCEDARRAFLSGADKIAINTAAVERPELITELAHQYGSQAIVLQIDAKRKGQGWEAYTHGGRQPTGRDAIAWAEEGCAKGAGEILVTSIDREGTRRGCDTELLTGLGLRSRVPLIVSGGVGNCAHVVDAFRAGADGVAMAHALHYRTTTLPEIRAQLVAAGIPVRPLEQVA